MPRVVESLIITLVIFGVIGAIVAVTWYAASHPWFATYIIMPVLGIGLFAAVWLACYMEIKHP